MNCENCSLCCKCSKTNEYVDLFYWEYFALKDTLDILGSEIEHTPFFFRMKLPCKFNKDNRCGIYESRPLMCRLYPFKQAIINDCFTITLHPICRHYNAVLKEINSNPNNDNSEIYRILGINNNDVSDLFQLFLKNDAIGLVLYNVFLNNEEKDLWLKNALRNEEEDKKNPKAFIPYFFQMPFNLYMEKVQKYIEFNAKSLYDLIKPSIEKYRREYLNK